MTQDNLLIEEEIITQQERKQLHRLLDTLVVKQEELHTIASDLCVLDTNDDAQDVACLLFKQLDEQNKVLKTLMDKIVK